MKKMKINMQDNPENHATTPPLCAKNCGLHGSAENKNLCSNCYNTFLRDEIISKSIQLLDLVKPDESDQGYVTSDESQVVGISRSPKRGTRTNRCRSCKKKVGLIGFECRCGSVFCGVHRYPEEHSCNVDRKVAERKILALKNLGCKGDKLNWRV